MVLKSQEGRNRLRTEVQWLKTLEVNGDDAGGRSGHSSGYI